MPRKLIKKYMPNEQTLRNNPSLRWLSKYIQHPSLWHLNRRSVSKAFLAGIVCAFLPIPMQMLVAAIFAIVIRANLAVSVGLVWITNPITMPPLFYFTYKIGTYLLGSKPLEGKMSFSYEYISSEIAAIWWPLLTGSIFCAVVFSILSFFAINSFWIWQVRNSWRNRKKDRKNKDKNA
jgi:uncharacterized protein (DUF2062 family)